MCWSTGDFSLSIFLWSFLCQSEEGAGSVACTPSLSLYSPLPSPCCLWQDDAAFPVSSTFSSSWSWEKQQSYLLYNASETNSKKLLGKIQLFWLPSSRLANSFEVGFFLDADVFLSDWLTLHLQCFVIYEDSTKIYTRLIAAIFDSAVRGGKKNRSSKVIENFSILLKEGRREANKLWCSQILFVLQILHQKDLI